MKKDWQKMIIAVQDASLGYLSVVLSIVCFLVALCVVMALVRVVMGVGA